MPNINIPQQKTSPKSREYVSQETSEKLTFLTKSFAEKWKELGIIVTSDCRVDMDNFKGIYSDTSIQSDKHFIEKHQSKFGEKDASFGIAEAVELLTTVIWNKTLGDNLVVVRSSMFDDIANGVDHLVLEKNTGKVICFIDEVSSLDSPTMHKKKSKTPFRKDIKYGFTIENNRANLKELKNIPVFYLGTPGSQINWLTRDLAETISSTPTKRELSLINFYLKSLVLQIMERSLEKDAKDLLNLVPESILSEMKKFAQPKKPSKAKK